MSEKAITEYLKTQQAKIDEVTTEVERLSSSAPIKVVRYGWQISGSASARSRLASSLSPSNSANSGDIPSGYSFLCWIEFTTSGWVGTPYAPNPMAETTEIWCYSDKPVTSGVSVYGTALYIRSDLI